MCGIAGAYFWTPNTAAEVSARVARMKDALRHRGPDGEGVWCSPTGQGAVGLAHTRLAIIDRSADANQPMTSPGCSSWIAYNGETYNFASLRPALDSFRPFRSRSDTEVVLRAYDRWGLDALPRLRGMFAFGIWDAPNRRLVLARDRLGIKPLYYFVGPGFLLFASEVRSLLASGLVPPLLDREGLWHYLGYQSLPAPRTLVQGVRMLAPGTWLTADEKGEIRTGEYWNLLRTATGPSRTTESERQSAEALYELLLDAVASHLVSDVPVAAFLSGGVDSTSVVTLMREAGVVPRTFCVGFREEAFDEGRYAREAAATLGCDHTDIVLGEDDLLAMLPDALASMDLPTGDGVNSYVIAKAVRSYGIAVALSGLGGDEFFGGYPSFRRLARLSAPAGLWGRSPASVRRMAAAAVRALPRGGIAASKAASAIESDGTLASLFPITRQLLSPEQRRELLDPSGTPDTVNADENPYAAMLAEAFEAAPDAGLLARVSYAEARTYMHDVLLRDTDQMSMAHALEVRVPLVDHVLVEHVMTLPDELKHPGKTPKQLLLQALGTRLPPGVGQRRKRGFTLPFDVWMRGRLRGFCEHRLGPDRLERRGLFRVEALRGLWAAFLRGSRDVSWARLWILVALDDWLERTGVEAGN